MFKKKKIVEATPEPVAKPKKELAPKVIKEVAEVAVGAKEALTQTNVR